MSPPILHSRWYEEKSWIYFYSMESLAGVGVAHQVEISAQQPGPATAPLQAGVAADHWSPVRRGWSSAWPQQPPSPGAAPPWQWPGWRRCRAPPAAQRPGSHTAEVRSKEKLSQGTTTYLPQWDVRSQENTILCKLITFVQNAGEADLAVRVIIHSVPFVQDKLFINKKKLNETTFLTTFGKNSSLLWGEITLSLAYISKTPSLQSPEKSLLLTFTLVVTEYLRYQDAFKHFPTHCWCRCYWRFSCKKTVMWLGPGHWWNVADALSLCSSLLYCFLLSNPFYLQCAIDEIHH